MQDNFKSLIELNDYFKEEKTCYEFLALQIWDGDKGQSQSRTRYSIHHIAFWELPNYRYDLSFCFSFYYFVFITASFFVNAPIGSASIDTSTMITLLNELVPKLTNLPEIFEQFPLHQQQLFISVVFSRPLSYFDGIYRTPSIYPIFADKALILKEKGLLEIEQPLNFLENSADCTPDGNSIQIEVLEGLRIAFAC